jgi:hypothetical protein
VLIENAGGDLKRVENTEMDAQARKPMRIVPKAWGREVWIVNSDLYCGKILEIGKGKRCYTFTSLRPSRSICAWVG